MKTLKELRDARTRLLAEAEQLRGADGTFASDADRTAFDAKMAEIDTIDTRIRSLEQQERDGASRLSLADTPSDEMRKGAEVERKRASEIRSLVKRVKLDESVADELIGAGRSIEEARVEVINKVAERDETPERDTRSSVRVETGEDARDKWLRGAENWLLTRGGVLDTVAKYDGRTSGDYAPGEFRGMTLVDLARESLTRAGVRWRGLDRMELVGQAFTRSANYQTVSDFALLLENTLNKALRAAYAVTPDTWSGWCGTATVTDFRTHNWYRMGSLSGLDELTEHGEFRNKTIPDAEKQTFSATTRGNIIGVTRQTIVNDDLGGLTRMATMLGRAAMLSIETRAYARLAENSSLGPNLSDGNPIFNARAGGNNIGAGAALSAAAIDADSAIMAAQQDVSGNEILDLQPSVLLVPRGLQGQANQINDAEFDPDGSKSNRQPNIVRGFFDRVIGTARLTGTRRYLFADPMIAPVMVVSFLEGEREPVIETQDGWTYDGVSLRARLDFGVDGVDFRGAVTDAGV